MPPLIDLTGQRFGRLVVLEKSATIKRKSRWLCKCDCGNIVPVYSRHLSEGITKSCGCLLKEYYEKPKLKHGLRGTRIYHIWDNMKRRCNNPGNPGFYLYGERGIDVCPEWNEFIPFYEWAIANGYKNDLQLDRKNNDKGYYPDNCRWATSKVNNRNKRTNRTITYNGETKILKEWSETLGINYNTLRKRIRLGWSIEKALTEPTDRRFSHARRTPK